MMLSCCTGLREDRCRNVLPLSHAAKERVGYPMQEPLALLERIIQASSNTDDMVLDPVVAPRH